jgi:hypothetical protein
MELLLRVRSVYNSVVAGLFTDGPTPIPHFTKVKLAILQNQCLNNNFKNGCLVGCCAL